MILIKIKIMYCLLHLWLVKIIEVKKQDLLPNFPAFSKRKKTLLTKKKGIKKNQPMNIRVLNWLIVIYFDASLWP